MEREGGVQGRGRGEEGVSEMRVYLYKGRERWGREEQRAGKVVQSDDEVGY